MLLSLLHTCRRVTQDEQSICPKWFECSTRRCLAIDRAISSHGVACTVAPHVRHEQLPSLLAVETSTHSMWRRLLRYIRLDDLLIQRQHTLGPMPALLASSTCLQPLNRASMTRVLVTSFSLKKRFTSPCAMCPYAVTQCLLESCYTVVMWLTCLTMQLLFATTASAIQCNNNMGQYLPLNMSTVVCIVLRKHIEVCSGSGLLSGSI